MNDYKELIDELRKCKYSAPNTAKYAADAIEQLVKERNEALNRLSWEKEARVERERERMLESCRNGDVYL